VSFWPRMRIACGTIALTLWWGGCAATGGEGSETHFVNCKEDSDCVAANAGDACVDGRCTTATEGAGGAAPDSGSGGGSGAASSGGSGAGGSPVIESCDISSSGTPVPQRYSVTFRLENRSNAQVAVFRGCYTLFEIFGCADGYTAPLPYSVNYAGLPSRSNGHECPDSSCREFWGDCAAETPAVTPGVPRIEGWDGSLREKDLSSGCGCVNTRLAPPGRYRVRFAVYPPGTDVVSKPSHYASADFELGDQADVSVTVALDQGSPRVPCAGLSATDCAAQDHCAPVMGRGTLAPEESVFAGCRTNRDDLPGTAFTCARNTPDGECYLFRDTNRPDGWDVLPCSDLPDDCRVAGNRHPAL
jgi:hypothetical protein